MIIDAVIQSKDEFTTEDQFCNDVVGWAHQCWQLYSLEKTIDVNEFKRRLNVSNINYRQLIVDYADYFDRQGVALYIERVIEVLDANPDEIVTTGE